MKADGLAAHVESIAYIYGAPVERIDMRSWRSTFIGRAANGAGTENLKRMVIERARQFGCDPLTHDAAEAFGLMDHLLHHYRIIPPWRVKNPFLPPVD